MPEETWKAVLGSPEFEASTHGRIRRKSTGRVKKPTLRSDAKLAVNLQVGCKSNTRHVHSIVAETFLGKRSPRDIVRFKDSDPTNCNLGNLFYEKRSKVVPQFPPASLKLKPSDVSRIRYLLDNKVSVTVVAGAFGVSKSLISNIKNGKKWASD